MADSERQVWMETLENFKMTSSNGNIFRVTGLLCGEFPGHGEFPSQRPVTRSFDVFFGLRLNKRLSKQSRRRWFETPSRPLWRRFNLLFLSVQNTVHDFTTKRRGKCILWIVQLDKIDIDRTYFSVRQWYCRAGCRMYLDVWNGC